LSNGKVSTWALSFAVTLVKLIKGVDFRTRCLIIRLVLRRIARDGVRRYVDCLAVQKP
jgi:hypothetical protein